MRTAEQVDDDEGSGGTVRHRRQLPERCEIFRIRA